jgi:WD40 repeat protein
LHRNEAAPRPSMESYLRVQAWEVPEWQARDSWTISGSWDVQALSPNGRWFAASAAPGTIQVRNLDDTPRTHTLALLGTIRGITFSPDGRLLAAATWEGQLKMWDVPAFHERVEFRAGARRLSALAFSPDSRRLATAGDGLQTLKLWDVATCQELITLPSEGETLREVLFTGDGNQLVARNSLGDLLFWPAPSFADIEKGTSTMTVR